jgi:hypothetical protein
MAISKENDPLAVGRDAAVRLLSINGAASGKAQPLRFVKKVH